MTVRRFLFGRRQSNGRVGRHLGRTSQLAEPQKGLSKELVLLAASFVAAVVLVLLAYC